MEEREEKAAPSDQCHAEKSASKRKESAVHRFRYPIFLVAKQKREKEGKEKKGPSIR